MMDLRSRLAPALLVPVAVAALYGAAQLSRPAARQAPAGTRVPITFALAACPGGDGTTTVRALPQRPGRLAVTAAGGATLAATNAPGAAWTGDRAGPVVVRADGDLAAGLAAERTTDRGLAAVRCAAPGTDLWFLGPGPAAGARLELHLANADDRTAAVDITALSGEGPLDTPDGRGVPVAPHATRVVRLGAPGEGLGDIVAGARDLALRVHATVGRVAASAHARAGRGADWLPLAPEPARALIVPGVPGGPGARRLAVAVPGDADARVRIQVLTGQGAFAPQGQEVLDAPARTVTTVDLDRALAGRPAAVRLTADRPVAAGFSVASGGDVAYGTATPPLGADGAFAADARLPSWLSLTAPEGPAHVQVAGTRIDVPAGRTVERPLAAGGTGMTVVPLAGSGPVHAARTTVADGRITVLPLVPAARTTWLPPVGAR